jgi:hypothetical protein
LAKLASRSSLPNPPGASLCVAGDVMDGVRVGVRGGAGGLQEGGCCEGSDMSLEGTGVSLSEMCGGGGGVGGDGGGVREVELGSDFEKNLGWRGNGGGGGGKGRGGVCWRCQVSSEVLEGGVGGVVVRRSHHCGVCRRCVCVCVGERVGRWVVGCAHLRKGEKEAVAWLRARITVRERESGWVGVGVSV